MATVVDEQLLDDEAALVAADERGALRALATAGAQVREALTLARDAGLGAEREERPRAVLVGALGGSAAVADIVALLAGAGSPVQVATRRGLPLPGWVGPLDLVVAVSVSGRAPGPVALAAEAGRRGARLLTVGASDSPLGEVCRAARGTHVDVGRARLSSRTSLWSLLTPTLVAADQLGLLEAPTEVLERVADVLDAEAEACRPASAAFVNPAKVLALELSGTVPVVLGDGDLTGAVARRSAAMLARTARLPAVPGALPDDADQVVATFGGPFTSSDSGEDLFADPFLDGPTGPRLRLVMLRDPLAGEEADRLAADVVATAEEAGVRISSVLAEGTHPLERVASLVARTDFAATYLALGLGLDPVMSPHVTALRDRIDD